MPAMDAWTAVAHALTVSAYAIVVSSFATEGDSETSIIEISTTIIDSASGGFECGIATLTTMNFSDRTACAAEIANFVTMISFVDEDEGSPVVNPAAAQCGAVQKRL